VLYNIVIFIDVDQLVICQHYIYIYYSCEIQTLRIRKLKTVMVNNCTNINKGSMRYSLQNHCNVKDRDINLDIQVMCWYRKKKKRLMEFTQNSPSHTILFISIAKYAISLPCNMGVQSI
jgi:hypothetical protein